MQKQSERRDLQSITTTSAELMLVLLLSTSDYTPFSPCYIESSDAGVWHGGRGGGAAATAREKEGRRENG